MGYCKGNGRRNIHYACSYHFQPAFTEQYKQRLTAFFSGVNLWSLFSFFFISLLRRCSLGSSRWRERCMTNPNNTCDVSYWRFFLIMKMADINVYRFRSLGYRWNDARPSWRFVCAWNVLKKSMDPRLPDLLLWGHAGREQCLFRLSVRRFISWKGIVQCIQNLMLKHLVKIPLLKYLILKHRVAFCSDCVTRDKSKVT